MNRQTEVETYDLKSFGKKPDMLFRLRSDDEPARVLSTQDGLFVECKPVDARHPAGGDYCDAGLIRFVAGAYAWAMQDALMVGYVRDQRTIQKHLCAAIETRPELCVIEAAASLPDAGAAAGPETEALYVSIHRRPFPWIGDKGPACPIEVYHSWLQAN